MYHLDVCQCVVHLIELVLHVLKVINLPKVRIIFQMQAVFIELFELLVKLHL